MSYRSSLIRLLKYGAVGGMVAGASVSLPEFHQQLRKVGQQFSVAAKSVDVDYSQVNDLYQGVGAKWNSDWDKR